MRQMPTQSSECWLILNRPAPGSFANSRAKSADGVTSLDTSQVSSIRESCYAAARNARDSGTCYVNSRVTKTPEMPTTHRGRIESVPGSGYMRSLLQHHGVG